MLTTITHLPIHATGEYGHDLARDLNLLAARRRRHEAARRALIFAIYAAGWIALGIGIGAMIRF
ncbi:MAG: hypothetical protein ABFD89_05310 [Bryobacteraceae bacterium]